MSDKTMRAAVLVAPQKLMIQERPIPQPGRGEVRVRIKAVGICGSDAHYFFEGRIGNQVVKYPTVLGHEPAGIIDALGEGVQSLSPGMRVAVEPAASCLHCSMCMSGQQHLCPDVQFLATPPYEGAYQEYIVMPERCCLPLPENLSFAEGALLEPFAVGLHAVRLAGSNGSIMGKSAAVFGCGSIGLSILLALRLSGAGDIYCVDLEPARLDMAMRLGASQVFNAAEGDPGCWIRKLTNEQGSDLTFEAAGEQATLTACCTSVARGGTAVLVGIPETDTLHIPMHECRRRELRMIHDRRSNNEAHMAIHLVAEGRVNIKPMATHSFPLDELEEAFHFIHERRDGVIRAMITP